jgi:hypothetical protein
LRLRAAPIAEIWRQMFITGMPGSIASNAMLGEQTDV